MYSDKIKAAKVEFLDNRVVLGSEENATRERLREIVSGFCTKEDLHCAAQTAVLDLFDEYCLENGYPLFKRNAIGTMFREVFGVTSKVARVNGKVIGIYF